jgi:hypothetical protein
MITMSTFEQPATEAISPNEPAKDVPVHESVAASSRRPCTLSTFLKPIPRNHKLISTQHELLEIDSRVGLHGMVEKTLLQQVNASLAGKSKDPVTMSTLRRAKKALR